MTENPVIVALDLPRDEALSLADSLRGSVRWLKVGMTLFYAEGPQIVARLREMGFDVFVDLKLHDIPHQVAGAAAKIARLGAGMLTVHASGGSAMVRAAVEASKDAASEAGLPAPAARAGRARLFPPAVCPGASFAAAGRLARAETDVTTS